MICIKMLKLRGLLVQGGLDPFVRVRLLPFAGFNLTKCTARVFTYFVLGTRLAFYRILTHMN